MEAETTAEMELREVVYVLTNPSMPGLIKIGRTTNLAARLATLSSATQVPEPFEVAYAAIVNNAAFVERALHVAFAPHRMRGREFFRLAPEQAIAALSLAEVEQVSMAIEEDTVDQGEVIAEIRRRGKMHNPRKDEMLATIVARLRRGEEIYNQDELAAAHNIAKATFSDWVKEWEALGYIERVRDGRCKRISAGPQLEAA